MNTISEITTLKNKIIENENNIRASYKRFDFLMGKFLTLGSTLGAITCMALGGAFLLMSFAIPLYQFSTALSGLAYAFFIISTLTYFLGHILIFDPERERRREWRESQIADRETLKQLEARATCSNDHPVCPCKPTCVPLPQVGS